MAGNSVIGALRVNLGIDSAQFTAGLKKAQTGLSSFGKIAAVGFAAVTAAAAAATAAMVVAGKRAIDTADKMSKTAQKVGVTTEALSRLKYAADFAGVGFEGLSTGLRKVGQNIADVANGAKGGAATAFQALGISVRDASGEIKSSDVVLSEVADRFSRMQDGAQKTSLAIQLFGKSGADLIPMLNGGAKGLKDMANESDRLGLTISTKTGKAAERFNDTLTKIGKIVEGVATRIATAALPALQDLANAIASPQFASAAEWLANTVLGVLNQIIQAARAASDAINYLATRDIFGNEIKPNELTMAKRRFDAIKALRESLGVGNMSEPEGGFYDGIFGGAGDGGAGAPPVFELGSMGGGGGGALAGRLEALRESLMSEEELEMASHLKRLAEIQKFYEQGAILRDEHDSLIESAHQQHADRMTEIAQAQAEEEARIRDLTVSGVASVFGSLSSLASSFGEKNLGIAKAFGVAEAVINTAKGITAAFALPPPASWAQAAAVAASGAAQIGTIMSASKGSSSKPSVGGGGSSEGGAPAQQAARSVSINLQGDNFSGASVSSLFQRLNEELGIDGLELVVNHKQA